MENDDDNEEFASVWTLVPDRELQAIMRGHYGLRGAFERLNSERDETYLFSADDGRRYVLKIANPHERTDLLAFQTGAFLHLERVAPDLPISRMIRSKEGLASWTLMAADGARTVRLLSYLDGEPLYRVASSGRQARQLGAVCALLARGLQSYEAERPGKRILWDMSGFPDLAAKLLVYVDPSRQAMVRACVDAFERDYAAVRDALPTQPIHNDFNPHNILVDPKDAGRITGVIDFGDMVVGTVAGDVGVALSYLLSRIADVSDLTAFIDAYCAVRPLSELELSLLPVTTRARLAMTILITEWRAALFPENRDYILRNHGNAVDALTSIDALPDHAFHPSQDSRRGI